MAKQWRRLTLVVIALNVATSDMLFAGYGHHLPANIRTDNSRIKEVIEFAVNRSPSFVDLLATFESIDRVVYIEEGACHHRELRSCLQLLPTPGGNYILVRIDPRQPTPAVVLQLAHELYHALEVGREPDVVDPDGLRVLYERIGERSCETNAADCFETRAAVTFERLVRRQLAESHER
jgi:hypothetical protein